MRWLIVGLLGLVLLVGLLMFIRGRGRSRPSADETLVTDLLGPQDRPAVPAPRARQKATPSPAPQAQRAATPTPAPQAQREATPTPAPRTQQDATPTPAPQTREAREPSPASSAPPAGHDDWLETQLAWIAAWSQRMSQQIRSTEQPGPDSEQ